MSKLIIVTGISGSGKTTISNYLYDHYTNSTLLSMDTIKESIYEITGFYSYEQKQSLKQVIYETFINLLSECMNRNDDIIIVEYPFNKSWEEKFNELIIKYNYDAITIKVKSRNFQYIYDRIIKRDNSSNRHPSHSVSVYNPKYKDNYTSVSKLDFDKLNKDYNNNKYTDISLGKVIDFVNYNANFEEIITNIDEWLINGYEL